MFFYIKALHIKARMIANFIVVGRHHTNTNLVCPQANPWGRDCISTNTTTTTTTIIIIIIITVVVVVVVVIVIIAIVIIIIWSSYRYRIGVRKNTIRMQLPPTVQLICPITCNPAIRASNCQLDQTILSVDCSYD